MKLCDTYSTIKAAAIIIAHDVGAINREESQEALLERVETCLSNFSETVLDAVNRGLAGVSETQLETICIGEYDDVGKILQSLNNGEDIDRLLNEIFEII